MRFKNQVGILAVRNPNSTSAEWTDDCCGSLAVCLGTVVTGICAVLEAIHLVATVASEWKEVSVPAILTTGSDIRVCTEQELCCL